MKITLPTIIEYFPTAPISDQNYGLILFKRPVEKDWSLGLICFCSQHRKQLVNVASPNQTWDTAIGFQFRPVPAGTITIEVP